MKKVIAGIVLLAAVLIGGLVYQINEKTTQTELYEEATAFFREEDYKKAIQYFEEASEHNNLFSGSMKDDLSYYQAEAYMKLEEYEEAIQIYDVLISDAPKDPVAYVMKAYCFSRLEDYEQAVSVYKQGYEKTKDSEFLYYLANLYVTMEEYDLALETIEGFREGDEEVVKNLAFLEIVVYEKQLDYETAYEKATAYCETYPEDEMGIKERDFLKSRR